MTQVTIAICTVNPDRPTLARVIRAIGNQDIAADKVETLLIDNGSAPPLTPADLPDIDVALLQEPRPGLTAARECAIAAAAGDVIVFVDDDNIIAPDFVRVAAGLLAANPAVALLGGAVSAEYAVDTPVWLGRYAAQLAIRDYGPDEWHLTTSPPYTDRFPIGAGLCVRTVVAREWVESLAATERIEGRVGGSLTAGEDVDMALFALVTGWHLAVSGKLRLVHVIPARRLTYGYMQALVYGATESALKLEAKWSPRFGTPVTPGVARSAPDVVARLIATWATALILPEHRLRHSFYRALIRARFGQLRRRRRGAGIGLSSRGAT